MRVTGFHAPLGGDVTQAINPWTLFIRSLGQLGLININIGTTPAPAVELLLTAEPPTKLSRQQMSAIHAFRAQLDAVNAIKRRAGRD
jgi:hypothetical protein